MSKPILHPVPFLSQRTDVGDESWQYRSCGVTALKMLLDYWAGVGDADTNSTAPLAQVLSTGLTIGAYIPNVGWSHAGLVNIGRQFGYTGYNQDLASLDTELAWQYLLEDLAKHPLLASIHPRFDPDNRAGHIIVVTGFDGELVFYNDPDEHNAYNGKKVIAIERFLRGWKKRYIVVTPIK